MKIQPKCERIAVNLPPATSSGWEIHHKSLTLLREFEKMSLMLFFLRMRVFGKSIGEEGKAIFLKEIHGPMVGNFDALIY